MASRLTDLGSVSLSTFQAKIDAIRRIGVRSHRPSMSRIVMPFLGLAGISCRRGLAAGGEAGVGELRPRTNVSPSGDGLCRPRSALLADVEPSPIVR